MRIIVKWLILTVSILITSYLMDGIVIKGFFSALSAAAILGILNIFFRPVLIILTLPINILSLGLFTLIINAMLLKMASGVIGGFEVFGFWTAVFGSLVISIVSSVLNSVFMRKEEEKVRQNTDTDYIDLEKKDGDMWE